MKKNKGESRLVVWDELKRIDDTCFGKITSYIIEAGKSKRYDGRCRKIIYDLPGWNEKWHFHMIISRKSIMRGKLCSRINGL